MSHFSLQGCAARNELSSICAPTRISYHDINRLYRHDRSHMTSPAHAYTNHLKRPLHHQHGPYTSPSGTGMPRLHQIMRISQAQRTSDTPLFTPSALCTLRSRSALSHQKPQTAASTNQSPPPNPTAKAIGDESRSQSERPRSDRRSLWDICREYIRQ